MPRSKPARHDDHADDFILDQEDTDEGSRHRADNQVPFGMPGATDNTIFSAKDLEEIYPVRMFYPDMSLFNALIAQGLSEEEADELFPKAAILIGHLCNEFRRSAEVKGNGGDLPLELPEEAPELFVATRGRPRKGADIISFLRRVWKPWIDAGLLTRTDLKRLDPGAYQALVNHMSKSDLPDDLQVPRLQDVYDNLVPNVVANEIATADEARTRAIRALAERRMRALDKGAA